MENKNGPEGTKENKDREESNFTPAPDSAGNTNNGSGTEKAPDESKKTKPIDSEESIKIKPVPQAPFNKGPSPRDPAEQRKETVKNPFAGSGAINYDKYDSQVKMLKNLGYTAQQITDNLLRLNPELHEKKHITSEVVGKYFPKPKSVLEEQKVSVVSGGMELTEEVKSFIESVLRRQLDAFRNVLREERERKTLFGEALLFKFLEWGPLLLTLTFFLSFSFLIYKGGLGAVKFIFYSPLGPQASTVFLLYPLVLLLVILVSIVVFFNEGVHERLLSDGKALIYLLLFPVILLTPVMALERHNNEANWENLIHIQDKEHFLSRWYEVDYKDKEVFLKRLDTFISLDSTDENTVANIARIYVYIDPNFVNKDFSTLCPDTDKKIALYKGVLFFDTAPLNRERAVRSLEKMYFSLEEDRKEAKNSLNGLKACLNTKKSFLKHLEKTDTDILYSPKRISRMIESNNIFREKAILNMLEEVLEFDSNLEVRKTALLSLKDFGISRAELEIIIDREKDKDISKELEKCID